LQQHHCLPQHRTYICNQNWTRIVDMYRLIYIVTIDKLCQTIWLWLLTCHIACQRRIQWTWVIWTLMNSKLKYGLNHECGEYMQLCACQVWK
jgi:hypothetical protein